MFQYDRALGRFRDLGIMGDDDQCRALIVELAEQIQDDVFICLIEVACRFIREDQFRMIDLLGWTYTDHVPGHALITWLIMH